MNFRSLKFKLLTLVFGGFIPIMVGIFFYLLPTYEKFFVEQKKTEIKTAVEIILGQLDKIDQRVQMKVITLEDARQETQALFKALRYGEQDYFFAYDANGFGMAHATSDKIVGTDNSNAEDAMGKKYVQSFMKIAAAGTDGYVDYQFERRKGEPVEDKISYVKFYKPWGWVVGTGVYISAIQESIKSTRKKYILVYYLLSQSL